MQLRRIGDRIIWEDFVGETNELLGYKIACSSFNRIEGYLHIVETHDKVIVNKLYINNEQLLLSLLYSYGFDIEIVNTIAWSDSTVEKSKSLLFSGFNEYNSVNGEICIDGTIPAIFLNEEEKDFINEKGTILLKDVHNGFGNYV